VSLADNVYDAYHVSYQPLLPQRPSTGVMYVKTYIVSLRCTLLAVLLPLRLISIESLTCRTGTMWCWLSLLCFGSIWAIMPHKTRSLERTFYLNRSNKVWIPSRGKDCQAVGGCSAHNGIRYPGLKKAGLRPHSGVSLEMLFPNGSREIGRDSAIFLTYVYCDSKAIGCPTLIHQFHPSHS